MPFHSSMSTRNQLVSSTGKFETIGSNFRQETRISEATAVLLLLYQKRQLKIIFYCKESINLPNASCPSTVCLKTPASSKPRSKISPTF